jgi:hypothetical protein
MKLFTALLVAWLLLAMPNAARPQTSQPLPRVVELKASDGTPLKASYFAADKAGPGVLLLHQSNRDRKSGRGSSPACGGWLQHPRVGHAWVRRKRRHAW